MVVLALAHNYDRLKEVPSDETNGVGVCPWTRPNVRPKLLATMARRQSTPARASG